MMTKYIRSVSACLILIFTGTGASFAETVLSDTDEGYQRLERFQKYACENSPTHPCNITESDCRRLMQAVSANVFPGDDDLKKEISEMCNIRGTRYEVPGVHSVLAREMGAVEKAARETGVALDHTPVVGPLAMNEANAGVDVKDGHPPIILMNIEFFEFANELSKIAAQAIPVELSDGQYRFYTDPAHIDAYIAANHELREAFENIIVYLTGGDKGPTLSPNNVSKTLQIVYFTGMEEFALGHEYGHIYYKHGSSALADGFLGVFFRSLFGDSTSPPQPKALQEVQADLFGLKLLRQIQKDNVAAGDNVMFGAVASAVKFYLLSSSLLEKVTAIKKALDNKDDVPPDPDYSSYDPDVAKIAVCVNDPGCNLLELSGLSKIGQDGRDHPPAAVRLKILDAVMGPPAGDSVSAVAELTNSNVERLWTATRVGIIKRLRIAN